MNLNKRVERTPLETKAFLTTVRWIDQCAICSGCKEHAMAIT